MTAKGSAAKLRECNQLSSSFDSLVLQEWRLRPTITNFESFRKNTREAVPCCMLKVGKSGTLPANTAGKRQVVPVPVVQAPLCIRSTHFGEGTVPNSSPDSCQAAQPSGAQSVFN